MINILTWNIRRGLLNKEEEIASLLQSSNTQAAFLNETDVILGACPNTFANGTTFYAKTTTNTKIRCLWVMSEELAKRTKLREDLMSNTVASVWLEYLQPNGKKLLLCGWYRQWADENGKKSAEDQLERMEAFLAQLEKACE